MNPVSYNEIEKEWDLLTRLFQNRIHIYFTSLYNSTISNHGFINNYQFNSLLTNWYKSGRDNREIVWTKPYLSEKTPGIVITASVGVYNDQDQFLGVMGVDSPLNSFLSNFKKEATGSDTRLLAVLSDNTVINFHRKSLEPIEYGSIFDWNQVVENPGESMLIDLNDQSFYTFSLCLEKLDVVLISLLPKEKVIDKIMPLMIYTSIVVLVFILLTLGGSSFAASSTLQNIRKLNDYIRNISQGIFTTQICVKGRDEFLTMNKSMNDMVEALSSNIIELKETNLKNESLINMRTTLLHVISHNASTPLTILFNNTMELLESDELNEEYDEMFSAAGNLKALIENTMVYLKLEEGIYSSNNQSLDLKDLSEIVCGMYKHALGKKNLRIEIDMNSLNMTGNYFLIKVVLENLIDNAVKYSFPNGSIQISGQKNRDGITWTIEDCGPGFSIQDRDNLYRKFMKLSARPTGEEKSTGLGLYLVKELMNYFGGEIHLAKYQRDRGALFTLSFPIDSSCDGISGSRKQPGSELVSPGKK